MNAMKSVCLLLGILALGASPGRAQQFISTFSTAPSGNTALSLYGWQAYGGASTAATYSNTAVQSGGLGYTAVSGGTGTGNPNPGFMYANGGTDIPVFALVQTFGAGSALTLNTGTAITFTMGNSNVNSYVSLMIQVGGDGTAGSGTWYTTTNKFFDGGLAHGGSTIGTTTHDSSTFPTASTASVTYEFDYSATASVWRTLTLTPGTSLSIGAIGSVTTNLPSTATITGFGFYVNPGGATNQTVRLDNIQIAAVPEPKGAAYLGFAGIGLALLAWRSRAVAR